MRAALGFALALATWPGPAAGAGDVLAFTLSSMPLRATGTATVHVLDARDGYAEAFGADLPADPERALAEARRRMATPAGRAALARIAEAAVGNVLAGRLGIEKLPAVVVDGRYVVYGVRDVARAVERVEGWRAAHEPAIGQGRDAKTLHPPPSRPRVHSGRPEAAR